MQHYNLYILSFIALFMIGFFFRDYEGTKKGKIIDYSFCFAIACIVSTTFNLSPFNQYLTNQDSSVFLYIGERMKEGAIPYRDLFDHKGIFLYFIQLLGVSLPFDNYTGVWILEIVNMTLTIVLLFKVTGLFTEKKIVRYASLIAVFLVCGFQFYAGGNYTEEWALPWISIAMYIFLKYLKEGKYTFSEIIWLGAAFSIVALLRINMVTIWMVMLPVVLIQMLSARQYADLFQCIKGFVLGIMIIVIPVLIYTCITGCLDDMIYCYIEFNFAYSDDAGSWSNIISSIIKYAKLIPFAVVSVLVTLIPCRNNKLYLINFLVLAVSLPFTFMSGRFDLNYGIVLLPYLVPFFVCTIEVLYRLAEKIVKLELPLKFMENKLLIVAMGVVVFVAFHIQSDEIFLTAKAEEIRDYIEETTNESDDVLILGSQGMNYYFLSDRRTDNKYFYQFPPLKISDDLCVDFLREMNDKPSDTIIVLESRDYWLDREDNLGIIYDFLENKVSEGEYICEDSEEFFTYHRVQTN